MPFSPGGTLFDSFLKNHWKEGKGGVQIYSLKKSSKNTALYTICADFSLANKEDADHSWGFLGQGKVYEERLAVLEEKTKNIINNSSSAVIWAIHFTPEDEHHMPLKENLRLLSTDLLIKKAKELGVNYIFTGHTHRKGYFSTQFDSGIKIHCSGTSACCDKDPMATTSMHIRKVLVDNKKISQILNLDLHWNGSDFIPARPHKEAQEQNRSKESFRSDTIL